MENEEHQFMDRKVLFAIDGLVEHGKLAVFMSIHAHIGIGLRVHFRQVDRSLQRMRKRGLLVYDRKDGWRRNPEHLENMILAQAKTGELCSGFKK